MKEGRKQRAERGKSDEPRILRSGKFRAARGDFANDIEFRLVVEGIVGENPIQRHGRARFCRHKSRAPPSPAKYVIRETQLKTATPRVGTLVSRKLAFSPSIAFLRLPLYGFNTPTLVNRSPPPPSVCLSLSSQILLARFNCTSITRASIKRRPRRFIEHSSMAELAIHRG